MKRSLRILLALCDLEDGVVYLEQFGKLSRNDESGLYDPARDPGESHDVAAAHPEIVAKLASPDPRVRGGASAQQTSARPCRRDKMKLPPQINPTWDGGERVPCIMRAPGKIPAGTVCDELTSTMDLLPTFSKLSSGRMPMDRVIDGHDISGLMRGEKNAAIPDNVFFFYQHTQLQAARSGRWKLVLPRSAATSVVPPAWAKMIAPEDRIEIKQPMLFDLQAYIGEKKDVAAAHPEVVAELMTKIGWAREDIGDYNRIGKNSRFFDPQPKRPDISQNPAKRRNYPADFTCSVAIGREPGVTRRDPSDVIKAGDLYYVWYSKVTKGPDVTDYPSGNSADVWYATSPDGHKWSEQGEAIGKGGRGAWDEHGVFTPNILRFGGKYYLYYTAVAAGHGNSTPTHIGVAVAEAPAGPWQKLTGNPVLSPSDDSARFDSMRVDDAAFAVRDGKIWFYYKGRMKGKGPGETKMGVAFADSPTGPFTKQGEPLHAGHEVMVRPQGQGVASLATAAGPRMVYYAADGLHFEPRNAVKNPPHAPGAWRSDDFKNNPAGEGLAWGISHAQKGGDLHLMRFDCQF